MKKKWLSLGLAGVMAMGLMAGCGEAASEGGAEAPAAAEGGEVAEAPAANAEGGSVYWLNFKPEADEALQNIAKTYTEETGVPVTVVTAAEGTYNSTLTSEMDKSDAPTLFVVGNGAAVKTWGDYCYDLNGTSVYNELSTHDFDLTDADGKVCSIGYCYESFGIIVNKALLEKAGYSLEDINNFDSLKKVADDIHARSAELGFDAFTSSGLHDASSWRFSGHLLNTALYYEAAEDGWTECPAEIKGTYMNYFKNLWDLYTTDTATPITALADGDGLDAATEFKKGEAVFYQNGTWEWSGLTSDSEDGTPAMNGDDLAMIPYYCGAAGEEKAGLNSGTENCWAVNAFASEEDIQATLDFMTWMVTSDAGTSMMEEQFGAIPYKSAKESTNGFVKQASDYLANGNYAMTWAFNYEPNVDEFRKGVVSAMNQYDAGEDWSVVENAVVAGWAAQYIEANAE